MPEEPQFHMTVVTQKRRRVENPRASHSGSHGHSAAEERRPGAARDEADAARGSAAFKAAEPARTEQGESASPSGTGQVEERQRSSHRRRYRDYGTVNLGELRDSLDIEPDFTMDPDGPVPSQGELQRQFYQKYDAILNRRYFTRNRAKVTRIIVITLLVAVIFVVGVFAVSSFTGSTAETLEKPEISTVPFETLDLGG